MSAPLTLLCLASYFKGMAFVQQAKALGCNIIIVAKESFKDEDWPREYIDQLYFMPNLGKQPDIIHAVSYLARSNKIDQIIALDDYDVETAAHLREHFRLPGIGDTIARHFRDKLAMRTCARGAGIRVPEFTGVFNYDRLREFMARVPPPYVLKPRSEASSMGIKKINHPDEIWPLLDAQGDQQSFFHLEQFVAGDVYHVDSLIDDGEVFFAQAHKYGMPPMSVYQGGGVFFTRSIDRHTAEAPSLFEFNEQLLKALGHPRGASHAEYIKSHADGQWYFLECAARVGGANIAEAVEYATGVNLWAEWAKIEVAFIKGEKYQRPAAREGYSGVINCLAQQEYPDLSGYNDPEVKWRLKKKHHAGLVVASPDAARVETLLTSYAERFAREFLMVLPPRDKPMP